MNAEEQEKEKHISKMELEGEELDQEVSVAEKKARIHELKRTYGPDWRKALNWAKSIRVDKEVAETLHGNFGSLRGYNDPRAMRR